MHGIGTLFSRLLTHLAALMTVVYFFLKLLGCWKPLLDLTTSNKWLTILGLAGYVMWWAVIYDWKRDDETARFKKRARNTRDR